jgi:ribonuclease-3
MSDLFLLLEEKLGFNFNNGDLLKEALTHRSYLNENVRWPFRNNERLEFLGDAVLELAVTEELFKRFPSKEEGELTIYRAALVNARMLSKISRELGLDKAILVSKGELKDIVAGGGEAILADGVEALIGALYLDGGWEKAAKFVRSFVMKRLPEVLKGGAKDAKSLVQEITQARLGLTPGYRVLEESGPAHQKVFKVGLYLGEELKSSGSGRSKQSAELAAAKKFLKKLQVGEKMAD